ncbi:unnamed protein product, partial [Penicillium salamii]
QFKTPKALNKLLLTLESMLDGLNPNEDILDVLGIDEAGQYLDSDTVSMYPLTFWKEYQSRFLAIVVLARDMLLFPATGAGVE